MTPRVSRWQEVLNAAEEIIARHGDGLGGHYVRCACGTSANPCPDRVSAERIRLLALAGVTADEQITKHLQATQPEIALLMELASKHPARSCIRVIHMHRVAALALLEPPHDKEHA